MLGLKIKLFVYFFRISFNQSILIFGSMLLEVKKIMSDAVSEFRSRDQGVPMTWKLQGLGNFNDKVRPFLLIVCT